MKERVKIPRHKIPSQEPQIRRHNFKEVNIGYTLELAQAEAQRCIMCANPPCVKGCPVHVKSLNLLIKSLKVILQKLHVFSSKIMPYLLFAVEFAHKKSNAK